MEPLLIVDLLNEGSDRRVGILEVAIPSAIDFFYFQCLDETLGPRVVIGITGPAHADGDPPGFQSPDVFAAGILNTPVGMMHQAWPRTSAFQRDVQGLQRQSCVELSTQTPAHDPSRVNIENYRQVDEFFL